MRFLRLGLTRLTLAAARRRLHVVRGRDRRCFARCGTGNLLVRVGASTRTLAERTEIDWTTVSALATAGGTLVLAVATFASVRSANTAARVAEQALLVGLRPLLLPSGTDDETQKVRFADGRYVGLTGGRSVAEVDGDAVFLAMSLRNAGTGIGVIHGWRLVPGIQTARAAAGPRCLSRAHPRLYVSPGVVGFWQGAIRDVNDPDHDALRESIAAAA